MLYEFFFLTVASKMFSIAAKLYLPKVNKSSGAVIDMWIKVLSTRLSLNHCLRHYIHQLYWQNIQAKELEANTESYIELLAKGIGKSKEEIAKEVQRPKYFRAQEAIDYGIADKIIDSRDIAFDKRVIFHCHSCFFSLNISRII